MKNLISTCFILLMGVFITHSLSAQSIGVRGGITIANQNLDTDGGSFEPDSRLGFQGGVVAETNLSGDLYLDAGLLFLQGGYKIDVPILPGQSVETDYIYNHISLPITALYKADLGGASIFGEAGPYVAYAMSAKQKQDDDEMDIELEDNDYNRLDFGLNVGAGVELSNLRVGVHYMLGLANLNDGEGSDDNKLTNRILGIYAAYMFGAE